MKDIRVIFIAAACVIIIVFSIFTKTDNNKYEEATVDKIKQFDTTNDMTEINKYSLKNISTEEIARLYYNDYKAMIVNYSDEAFEKILNKNISKDEFLGFREKIMNNYYKYNYKSYSYYLDQENDCYVYNITDSMNNNFTFKIYSVMQYEVELVI